MSDGKDNTGPAAPEGSASTSQGEPSTIPSAPDVPPQERSVVESAPQPPSDPPANVTAPTIPEAATTTPPEAAQTIPQDAPSVAEDRTILLERARHFLASPQIQQQDDAGKRRFLSEKGLKAEEVDAVLRETRLLPPPPTYPQPPPSNLPGLLLAAARALSWIAGGSAILIFIYYRFLLPRILRTASARRGLLTHQRSLMDKFHASLKSTKDTLTEDLKDVPRPDPNTEPVKWRDCHTVKAALQQAEAEKVEVGEIPTVTLLRCALEELKGREKKEGEAKEKEKEGALPTTEDVFRVLEGRIPWLLSEDGLMREGQLWDMLSTSPLFASEVDDVQGLQRWRYVAPEVPPTPPLLSSLSALSESMSKLPSETENRPFQRTLQTLGDFTGYLSSQVYAPFRPNGPQYGLGSSGLGPVEEDMRKEIRALKGLVLNR
ncbi:hypothetical protein K525DRAFT_233079 [Schizophyllum commune Loenen D]|nr:hypothetical protein K525DRAFT_233079 [Schizophyllum commune Loenen D]